MMNKTFLSDKDYYKYIIKRNDLNSDNREFKLVDVKEANNNIRLRIMFESIPDIPEQTYTYNISSFEIRELLKTKRAKHFCEEHLNQ
jgi:hypothetical protein